MSVGWPCAWEVCLSQSYMPIGRYSRLHGVPLTQVRRLVLQGRLAVRFDTRNMFWLLWWVSEK